MKKEELKQAIRSAIDNISIDKHTPKTKAEFQ